MNKAAATPPIVALLGLALAAGGFAAQQAEDPPPPPGLVGRYCYTCHNDVMRTGGMTLAKFDPEHPEKNAAIAEKMIRKLRAGMMPPPGNPRPDPKTLLEFVASLETRIDQAAALRPDPGWRPFQRLNRAEYAAAVRDLLGMEVDVTAYLPAESISHGFDNVADVQSFSPTLMEGYLRAASQISRLALGDPHAAAGSTTYKMSRMSSQLRHVPGAPVGTRGGLSVVHTFPADGDYSFRVMFFGGPTSELFAYTTLSGTHKGEQLEVSLDGERLALFDIDPKMSESDPNGLSLKTPPLHVKAGPRRVSAAFVQRSAGPVDDVLAPIEYSYADARIGTGYGVTSLPHLRDLTIIGPSNVTGVSDTPVRRKILTCRPGKPGDETCAREILRRLAGQAYRGAPGEAELVELMALYRQGREKEGFEGGIRLALQAILAHPRFVLRVEHTREATGAGHNRAISDHDLASRLSFFLWGALPDAELLSLARQGSLSSPAVLEQQVRRMLRDPRSLALATRFAAQWLRLQDIYEIRPDSLLYPYWDRSLSESFQRETELFFDSLVREDRSALELLTADYTFVNERVARHYGIAGVAGSAFRRVKLEDPARRGILGHGSVLLLTSVADRTSPVQRGKWVMEVLLGTPPPPPPPDVPDLENTQPVAEGKTLSVRARMEQHRSNFACRSCHRVIDPLGLALENFDATGKWRIKDNGMPVDASGELYDGTRISGPAGLREALLRRSDVVLTTFTENLMTYALGRRVEHSDMPALRAILREAGAKDNRISAFVLGVVKSAPFQMSRGEAAPAEDPGPAPGSERTASSRR